MKRFASVIGLVGLLLGFTLGTACSIAKSSKSISNSISSPLKSSSASSSPGDDSEGKPDDEPQAEDVSYEDDVTEYAYAFARDHKDPQPDQIASFRAGLARLAEKHGITDWENDPLSVASIGRGLARAGVTGTALRDFSTLLFGADLDKLAELEKGAGSSGAVPAAGTQPPSEEPGVSDENAEREESSPAN